MLIFWILSNSNINDNIVCTCVLVLRLSGLNVSYQVWPCNGDFHKVSHIQGNQSWACGNHWKHLAQGCRGTVIDPANTWNRMLNAEYVCRPQHRVGHFLEHSWIDSDWARWLGPGRRPQTATTDFPTYKIWAIWGPGRRPQISQRTTYDPKYDPNMI